MVRLLILRGREKPTHIACKPRFGLRHKWQGRREEGGRGMNPAIFREYDIRGAADQDFDVDFAFALGRAYGTLATNQGKRRVSVGRDCRPRPLINTRLRCDRDYAQLVWGSLSLGCVRPR